MRLSRILLWGLLAVAGATALLIGAIRLLSLSAPSDDQVLQCGILALLHVALALGCAVAMERGPAPRLMRSGIIAAAIALAGWTAVLFLAKWDTWWLWHKAVVWPTAWACLMLVIGVLLLPRARGGWFTGLRRLAIALVSLLAVHICFAVTLYGPAEGHDLWNIIGTVTWLALLVAAVVVLIVLLLSIRRGARFALRWLIITIGSLIALHLVVSVVLEAMETGGSLTPYQVSRYYADGAYRIGWVLGLIAAGAFCATFLALWMPALTGRGRAEAEVLGFELRCPRCGLEQTAQTGGCACRRCGLSIKVELP